LIRPSSTEQAEDHQLVDLAIAYQGGDLGAFKQLYSILLDEARRYFARTHRDPGVVQDLVQDLFLEMHRSRRTYTPPLPVRPWIFGIARNVSARSWRAAHQQPLVQNLYDEEGELAVPAPESHALSADALDIENAVAALPTSTRDPWLLHHVFGLSFHSIAARLGITVMAAKLRSSRATRALREALSR
jgi:RNA polymerase sigma-70 factor (ECF subfamily)